MAIIRCIRIVRSVSIASVLLGLLAPVFAVGAFELAEPTSFEGTLPCADCPGINWHLDLWPDGRFHLRRIYLDRGNGEHDSQNTDRDDGRDDDMGRWRINPADDSLLLFGGREAPLRIAVIGDATLRLLDRQGRTIDSQLPYEL
ncbi:MAG: copper resistance protein NlpE, partial [Congregibacter sp.]|nr:copper resistance protein NlpE [Congregibacter sp.]